MLQPVGGEVGVDARVIGDGREIDEEKQSQSQGGEYGSQKETAMFPDQREHVGNIARIVRFSSSRNRPRMGASPKSISTKGTGSHARRAKAMDPDNGVLNFALANCNLPVIIFCLSAGLGWRVRSRIDVAVAAVRYRAFVFAAPPYFVAGNRSTESRGAVSV